MKHFLLLIILSSSVLYCNITFIDNGSINQTGEVGIGDFDNDNIEEIHIAQEDSIYIYDFNLNYIQSIEKEDHFIVFNDSLCTLNSIEVSEGIHMIEIVNAENDSVIFQYIIDLGIGGYYYYSVISTEYHTFSTSGRKYILITLRSSASADDQYHRKDISVIFDITESIWTVAILQNYGDQFFVNDLSNKLILAGNNFDSDLSPGGRKYRNVRLGILDLGNSEFNEIFSYTGYYYNWEGTYYSNYPDFRIYYVNIEQDIFIYGLKSKSNNSTTMGLYSKTANLLENNWFVDQSDYSIPMSTYETYMATTFLNIFSADDLFIFTGRYQSNNLLNVINKMTGDLLTSIDLDFTPEHYIRNQSNDIYLFDYFHINDNEGFQVYQLDPNSSLTEIIDELQLPSSSLINHPNPFNPSTTISYCIPFNQNILLEIYNIKGQKIRTLINKNMNAGKHDIVWKGKDNSNKLVSSGVYYYKLILEDEIIQNKMLLLK